VEARSGGGGAAAVRRRCGGGGAVGLPRGPPGQITASLPPAGRRKRAKPPTNTKKE